MTALRMAMLGLITLAAFTGCATQMASVAGSNGAASPATYEPAANCEGWYDSVAGACDSMGTD